jgi:hypothetical protein
MIMRELPPPLAEIGHSWDLLPTKAERLLGLPRDAILALAQASQVRISIIQVPGRKREYWLVSIPDLVRCIESGVRALPLLEQGRGA